MGGIVVKISHEMLKAQAEATGFRTDILEKVGLLFICSKPCEVILS